MHSRLRLLICLVAAAVLVAACSSTTVVARDERATQESADEPPASESDGLGDVDDDDDSRDADDDSGADDDDDSTSSDSDDRGGRDEGAQPGDVDFTEGFGLGGAEQLEGLLVDCRDGDDLACDILFQISAFDSEEETAALTCGGRSDVEVSFCTGGIEPGEDELVFDPASDGLDRVVEACEVDANMTACDFLYYRSPIDSEFQEIGGTCGGRVNVAVPDCRSIAE